MFNTNLKLGSNTQDVTFNSTSTGHLQKSNPQSRFIRFQRNSEIEKRVFPTDGIPYISKSLDYPYKKKEITVLQVLVFGEDYYLCEIVENEALEEKIKEKY